jgi:indole-3-glycerol phosphate synthase
LEVLVEVHNPAEIETALGVDPEIVGINNRDLNTFVVDLQTTEKLRPLIPAGIVCVSESGINKTADLSRLAACDIDAALIGEALVTSSDPAAKIRELLGKRDDQD